MSLIKAWIYAAGIEQFIYRKCLRKDVRFMGFLLPVSPVREEDGEAWDCLEEAIKHADDDTFFLIREADDIPFFESYGIRKECILVFYRISNLWCGKKTFRILNKKKWLQEHLLRRTWALASDEIKNKYFMRKYIDRDIRLWQQCDCEREERIVFCGVNEWTEDYIKRCEKKIWGIIPINQESIPKSLRTYEREYADLLYEDTQKLIFYVGNDKTIRRLEGYLKELGIKNPYLFTYGRWEQLATGGATTGGAATDILDPLIGYTRRYQDLCGFKIFGAPGGSFRILTLGGSTSDPTYGNLKSWPEILHDMLQDMGIDAVVYAGGISAYFSSQECLKLLKDAIPIKPNIIISYSGVNDLFGTQLVEQGHPFITPYLRETLQNGLKRDARNKILTRSLSVKAVDSGVEDNSSPDEFWLRCEKIMHAICREMRIAFHAFLQPNNMGQRHFEVFWGGEKIKRGKILHEKIRKYKEENDIFWLHDATNIFDGDSGIFYDYCHVYEKGNRIIARTVLPIVLREMESAL